MSKTVQFTFEVEVDGEFIDEDMSDEDIIVEAEEILYSAPAFDGISDWFIDDLKDAKVVE